MDLVSRLSEPPRFFPPPCALALGLAAGFYPGHLAAGHPAREAAFVGAAFLVSGMSIAFGSFEARGLRRLVGLCAALGLLLGLGLARDEAARVFRMQPGAAAWVEGLLIRDSAALRNGYHGYDIRVTAMDWGLALGKGGVEFKPAPILRVLARESPALDAGLVIRAEGSFSQGKGGLPPVFFAKPRRVELVRDAEALARLRSFVRSSWRRALAKTGNQSAGLIEALLMGSRENLDTDLSDTFRRAGCSHVLALSGQHLSILALLAVFCVKPLLGPLWARVGAALFAALFTWIAGASPSLLRSVVMLWLGLFALVLDRPQGGLSILSLTFVICILVEPSFARSLGFVLSYLAVFGLVVLSPMIEFILDPVAPPVLSKALSASLGAQLATIPVVAFSFGLVPTGGLFAAMASAPLVAALMWWAMGAALLCSLAPTLSPAAALVSDSLYKLLVAIMQTGAAFPVLRCPGPAAKGFALAACLALSIVIRAWPRLASRLASRVCLAPCPSNQGPITTRPRRSRPSLKPSLSPCPNASAKTFSSTQGPARESSPN